MQTQQPQIPRSEWSTHEHYPQQALLLGSHDNFRRISEHLVSQSMHSWSLAPSTPPRSEHLALFRRWKAAMRSHEHYEEHKLYPYLHARYGVSMAILELQHRRLGVADDRVLAAYRDKDALRFASELKAHDEILLPHLMQEEELVIPLLLSLSPAEFQRYSQGSIASLLRALAKTPH